VAITPNAWDDRAPRRRQAERLGDIQSIVIRIMSAVERNIKRGCSTDQVEPVVRAWAGQLAPLVEVGELRARGVLVLHATHPLVIQELRPHIYRLQSDLKSTGITRIIWG